MPSRAFVICLSFLGSISVLLGAIVLSRRWEVDLVWPLILASAGWATWDAKKLGRQPAPALAFFFGLSAIWIAGFPWYLSTRYEMKRRLALG